MEPTTGRCHDQVRHGQCLCDPESGKPAQSRIRVGNGDGNADGIKAAANYLTIDGFEIFDPNPGVGHHGNGVTVFRNHHINIRNNKIYNFGGSCIQGVYFDHIYVENNIVYNCAKYKPSQTSGISMYQARAVDNASGYHVIIRNNISYGNINLVTTAEGRTRDGNGILIDDFKNETGDGNGVIFPHRTLIENNVSYDNGGKGIQVFRSRHVDVFNNTAYHNNHDRNNPGTWRAELSLVYSQDTKWRNNIGFANPGSGILEWNRGILIANSSNTVWENNITYSGTPGDISIQLTGTSTTENYLKNNNQLGVNPLFINRGANNFSLQPGSPAINAGSNDIISFFDINYIERPRNAVDIGAYEYLDGGLPVELTSFEAIAETSSIHLYWTTASELNNAGFTVELRTPETDFEEALFVEGFGTTDTPQDYQTSLTDLPDGTYLIRLKQTDFDGTFAYSSVLQVLIGSDDYQLAQSYPNPFNPQTRIQYSLPLAGPVKLEVFDLLGRSIQVLVDQEQIAGTHAVIFEAQDLPNGTYLYRLTAGTFSEAKTMVLLK